MEVASFYDTKGNLYIDCTECERGRFGNDEDKCSAGYRFKTKNHGGCFIGDIIPKYKIFIEEKSIQNIIDNN